MKINDTKILLSILVITFIDGIILSIARGFSIEWLFWASIAIFPILALYMLYYLTDLVITVHREAHTTYEINVVWFLVGLVVLVAGAIIHNGWFRELPIWLFLAPGMLIELKPMTTIYFIVITKIAYAIPAINQDMKRLYASALLSFLLTTVLLASLFTDSDFLKYFMFISQDHGKILEFMGVFTVFTYFSDRIVENYEDLIKEPMSIEVKVKK